MTSSGTGSEVCVRVMRLRKRLTVELYTLLLNAA